jgi:hypothetical protein
MAVTWLRLSEATTLIDHNVQRARERLERAISKSWRVPPGRAPHSMIDPNVPLRIRVEPPPGLQIEGRAWLDNPVLDWEVSEVECLCKPWTPARQALLSAPAIPCRAKIEVWSEDLFRLWGGDNSESQASEEIYRF